MAFDTLQHSRILHRIMGYVGLWTESETTRVPPIVSSLLVHVPLTFTYTILMWLDVIFSSDLSQATGVLYIAFTETCLVVKILSILHHRRLAKSIFRDWQSGANFKLQTVQEQLMWKGSFKTFGVVAFMYIGCSVSVVAIAFGSILFVKTYVLPFPYWTPFDDEDPRYFWYAFVYEALAMPVTCISNCTLDMWQCYMMQHLAICFQLIAMRLQSLGRRLGKSEADVTEDLIGCIKFDQQLRRMSKQCGVIVSYPILAQILLSGLVLCFSLYRLQNVNFLNDPGSFTSTLQYVVCMIFQIFLPCYYANQLTVQSSRLMNSIYNCNWTEMSPSNRRMILSYMQYLNKPVILKAGKFFDIGLHTFTKTMNNAYSFFALLLNMDIE